MSGIKRRIEDLDAPLKKPLHSFFTAKPEQYGKLIPSPPTVTHFLHLDPLSPNPNPNGARVQVPIIFYDLDGTLIKTKKGADFPSSRNDWVWWNDVVPGTLKKEWEEGKNIVVLSNQGDGREKIRLEWKAKLPLITSKLPDGVPIRIIAALNKFDIYRKPNTGMFDLVRDLYKAKGLEVDMANSIYVGDAAGRMGTEARKKDHGDTDYKLALNIGLKFFTPEEHFLGAKRPVFPEPPTGFHPSKLNLDLPHVVPSNTPIAHKNVEVVIFIGPPASGKSTFYHRHFHPVYEHVNQDTLKSRDKCFKVAEASLRNKKSVVVDNTNRNRATRALWVALAAKLDVPIRAFHFNTSLDLARHNNMYRACYGSSSSPDGKMAGAGPERTLLPLNAFTTYHAAFERPEMDEGFDEIRTVNFVWEGTDEQRRLWERYMLVPSR